MKKLHEILGLNNKGGCKIGIEIEAEGTGIQITNLPKWNSTDDGSLRGSFPNERHEFVSGILDYAEVGKCLDDLIEEQKNAKFNFSFRTSTHVHVNALDMEVEQVVSFIYLYYLFEKDMMKYCGPDRINNRFCLRLVDSEYQVDILRGMIDNCFRELRFLIDENMRYGGCNMAALLKYGTLEFRGMRGTLDKEVLMNWIGMLARLRELAMAAPSTMQIFTEATSNVNNFIKQIYGPYFNVFASEESVQNITEALSLTVQIPFLMQECRKGQGARKQAKQKVNPLQKWEAQARVVAAGHDRARLGAPVFDPPDLFNPRARFEVDRENQIQVFFDEQQP